MKYAWRLNCGTIEFVSARLFCTVYDTTALVIVLCWPYNQFSRHHFKRPTCRMFVWSHCRKVFHSNVLWASGTGRNIPISWIFKAGRPNATLFNSTNWTAIGITSHKVHNTSIRLIYFITVRLFDTSTFRLVVLPTCRKYLKITSTAIEFIPFPSRQPSKTLAWNLSAACIIELKCKVRIEC